MDKICKVWVKMCAGFSDTSSSIFCKLTHDKTPYSVAELQQPHYNRDYYFPPPFSRLLSSVSSFSGGGCGKSKVKEMICFPPLGCVVSRAAEALIP